MANIVVVTKDIAEFQIYHPVVELLRTKGHQVIVLAEGLSLDRWVLADTGTIYDPTKFYRDDFNPVKVLEELKPDLVLTGLGMPINLGEKFGLAANELGIKLGFVEDLWGVHLRSKAVPNFICTIDLFARAMIASNKGYRGKTIGIHVLGNPSWDQLANVSIDLRLDSFTKQFATSVLIAGQDESTTPLITGVVKTLDQSCLIIPRLHPKFLAREDLVGTWLGALAKTKAHVLWVPPAIPIQSIMRSVKYTVSVYSNALIEAAALGSLPVSWVSDIGREKMAAALGGLTRFPLVDSGCAVELETPEQFCELFNSGAEWYETKVRLCCSTYRCDGKNTERVVSAIESELRA